MLLCLLSAGVALNLWVGYFRTVQAAWNELTAGPLPDETDLDTVMAMRGKGAPAHGALVPVTIPDEASGFKHRTELVYLPPAWFAANAPKLPVVMMIAGEFNTPSDWPRTGNAIAPIDKFAAAHGGNAPVFVFVDVGGSFNNDTECVNGPRGNVADHLTKDVPPYVVKHFRRPDSANWGVVGWSMGGTCAVDLTVMHPELFSTFVDIAGDMGPTRAPRSRPSPASTAATPPAWADLRPHHGDQQARPLQGRLGVVRDLLRCPAQRKGGYGNPSGTGLGGQDAAGNPGDQTDAANSLCKLGRANGIACAVVAHAGQAMTGRWPTDVFTSALPWLAGQIGTPGVPKIPLPGGGCAGTGGRSTAGRDALNRRVSAGSG